MLNQKPKCIIILSTRSSGSSACQNLLAKFSKIVHLNKTRHFQNETLYWTKAASVLRMQQIKMQDSEVPIPAPKAKKDLFQLFQDNLLDFNLPKDEKRMIFAGWRALCHQYRPIFLEKSPHHLCQWSSLELIMEAMESMTDIDFILIGLVRNPMDMLYSAFKRWRIYPEKEQYEWEIAYRNLLKLQERVPHKLVIVRYEDMISDLNCLNPVFEFCGTSSSSADKTYMHKKSLQKWKGDRFYGFKLDESVLALAKSFDYTDDELRNSGNSYWSYYSRCCRGIYKIISPFQTALIRTRKFVKAVAQA